MEIIIVLAVYAAGYAASVVGYAVLWGTDGETEMATADAALLCSLFWPIYWLAVVVVCGVYVAITVLQVLRVTRPLYGLVALGNRVRKGLRDRQPARGAPPQGG